MAVGEIIGGAIGGVAGAGLNYINARQNAAEAKRAAQEKQRVIGEAGAAADTEYQAMLDMLNEWNENRTRLSTPEMVEEYQNLISEYQPQTYDFGKFSDEYNKTVEDFLNPEAEKIAELAGLKKQAELAGQGAAGGTAGLAGMGYSRWEAAENLYKDAQDALRQDRAQAYTEYGDYIDRMQKKLDTLNEGKLAKINLLGGNISQDLGAESDYMADLMAVMGDKASSRINTAVGAYS